MTNYQSLRWRVVLGGIICQFCAGMLYSWSLYVRPLTETHGFNSGELGIAFSIATFLIPVLMIFGGKLLPKLGPTKVALIGAVSLITGLVISGLSNNNLYLIYIGYGFFGGMGVGFIYGVPIATCVKWFPDKKGMISGITIAGFGLGSIIFAPIGSYLIENIGPNNTFLVQAAIVAVGMFIGAPMMKAAPDGYLPPGYTPLQSVGSTSSKKEFTSPEMLRTKEYKYLLVMYLFANVAGLFAIGNASPISQEIAGITPEEAGAIVSVLAIANTFGRFLAGMLCDKIGAAKVVTLIYILNTALFLSLNMMTNFVLMSIGIAGLALCFGGMMGSYPSLVLDYFGAKYVSTNYALVFLAYGIGGLLTSAVGNISTQTGNYDLAFIIIGISCAIGVVMSLFANKIQKSMSERVSSM